jgi:hypothetical protein
MSGYRRFQGRLQRQEIVAHKPQTSPISTKTPGIDTNDVVDLQRLIGNQGVQRLLADNPSLGQAKLTVGAADDQYEREADSVASQVMSMQTPAVQKAGLGEEDELSMKRIQRMGEEEEMSLKRIQRAGIEEEEMSLKRIQRVEEEELMSMQRIQRAEDDQVDMMGSFDVSSSIERQISDSSGSGSAMPKETQSFMGDRFGQDFSDVRVHTGSQSTELNSSLGAKAFTHGNDIFFGDNQYNPSSSSGKELLAHELTHTVQQTGGKPVQKKNDDE